MRTISRRGSCTRPSDVRGQALPPPGGTTTACVGWCAAPHTPTRGGWSYRCHAQPPAGGRARELEQLRSVVPIPARGHAPESPRLAGFGLLKCFAFARNTPDGYRRPRGGGKPSGGRREAGTRPVARCRRNDGGGGGSLQKGRWPQSDSSATVIGTPVSWRRSIERKGAVAPIVGGADAATAQRGADRSTRVSRSGFSGVSTPRTYKSNLTLVPVCV
jgi:hypothetical protein